jgi:hypothetical protein
MQNYTQLPSCERFPSTIFNFNCQMAINCQRRQEAHQQIESFGDCYRTHRRSRTASNPSTSQVSYPHTWTRLCADCNLWRTAATTDIQMHSSAKMIRKKMVSVKTHQKNIESEELCTPALLWKEIYPSFGRATRQIAEHAISFVAKMARKSQGQLHGPN